MNLNGLASIATMRSLLFVALTTLNLFAEGEPKMPTLNWMGREKATKSVKDVVMKILREDKSLGYEKQTDLLTPNGVRDAGSVSRVSGEQIRLLNNPPEFCGIMGGDEKLNTLLFSCSRLHERLRRRDAR